MLSHKIGENGEISALTISLQHLTRSPSQDNKMQKRKGTQIGKEKVKLSLFVDNMTAYVEKSQEILIKKLL